jgi:hypothetical protein
LVALGALGCHGKFGGAKASQPVDVTQPPSVTPTSRPQFQIQNGAITIIPDADYSASGVVGAATTGMFGGVGISWGTGSVVILNASDDATIVNTIGNLTKGQHVRVSGFRAAMERGGKKLPSTTRQDNQDDVIVFPTELQVDDTIYKPAKLPPGVTP